MTSWNCVTLSGLMLARLSSVFCMLVCAVIGPVNWSFKSLLTLTSELLESAAFLSSCAWSLLASYSALLSLSTLCSSCICPIWNDWRTRSLILKPSLSACIALWYLWLRMLRLSLKPPSLDWVFYAVPPAFRRFCVEVTVSAGKYCLFFVGGLLWGGLRWSGLLCFKARRSKTKSSLRFEYSVSIFGIIWLFSLTN